MYIRTYVCVHSCMVSRLGRFYVYPGKYSTYIFTINFILFGGAGGSVGGAGGSVG